MQISSGFKDLFDMIATPIQTFDDLEALAVSSVDEHTSELNLKRHNLTIKGMADDSGLMETNSTTEAKNQLTENKIKEKRTRNLHLLLEQIEQARIDAERLRNLIDMKLEELDTNISGATTERNILQDEANTLSDAIQTFEETGQFDLNEDGTFKDEVLEAAIVEWETQNGAEVDRENYALLAHILETKRDEYNDQISTLDKNINQWEQEKRDYEDLDERLTDAEAKLVGDDPDLQAEGAREIQELDSKAKDILSENHVFETPSNEDISAIDNEVSQQINTITTLKF